jgi:hypothetical protein
LIAVAFGKFAQDARAGDHASAVDALVDEGEKMLLLVIAELDSVRRCDSWHGRLQVISENIAHKTGKSNPAEKFRL